MSGFDAVVLRYGRHLAVLVVLALAAFLYGNFLLLMRVVS
jgi:hypothetical protein